MSAGWPPILDQANRRKLAATIHIHHSHCYYYSARKLILILSSRGGWKAESTYRHCSRGAQPVPKAIYRTGCRDRHNRPRRDSNLGPLTPQSDALTTQPLRPAAMLSGWEVSRQVGSSINTMRSLVNACYSRASWRLSNTAMPCLLMYTSSLLAHFSTKTACIYVVV